MRGHTGILDCGRYRRLIVQHLLSASGHRSFNLWGWEAPTIGDPVRGTDGQTAGDIVAVPTLTLARMAWRQTCAGGVKQLSKQRAGLDLHRVQPAPPRPRKQMLLHLIPYLPVNDGLVLPRIAQTAMTDLAYIKWIGEHRVERAARERISLRSCSVSRAARLGDHSAPVELVLK